MTTSSITCPHCRGTCSVPAPDHACAFFHACECCGVLLRPVDGDCCVICSFGPQACPPRQREQRSDRA